MFQTLLEAKVVEHTISRTDERARELEFYCSMFESNRNSLDDEVDQIARELQNFTAKIRQVYCFINPEMDELDVSPIDMLRFL